MNAELPPDDGSEPEQPIILIEVTGSFYLLEGELHMKQMMFVDGTYPTPVRCVRFESVFELRAFLGGHADLSELWGINPKIIERLRRDQQLLEIDAPSG